MVPQGIEDSWTQINLYMLFNQHDFTATLCISLTSLDYFRNTISEIVPIINPAKRNVLDLKNETCKNLEKRNVLKKSRTRHFKAIKKQSKTGCFYSF